MRPGGWSASGLGCKSGTVVDMMLVSYNHTEDPQTGRQVQLSELEVEDLKWALAIAA